MSAAPLLLAALVSAQTTFTVSGASSGVVGQELTLEYALTGPALEPDVLASAATSFAVVKAEAAGEGRWAWTVLPLDAGRQAFVARWKGGASAPPAPLEIGLPELEPGAELADIKPPAAARPRLWPWLLAALLALAAWAAWKRLRRRAGAPVPGETAYAPPPPPEEAAERAVAALLASGLWEKGAYAEFYLRLTDILREYLESRYAHPATAMTSVELARLVRDKAPELRASGLVRELMQRADLVKFARIKPGPAEGPGDAERLRELVRLTTPEELAAPGRRS